MNTEYFNTVYHVRACSFLLSTEHIQGSFFNADTSSKKNCNGNFQGISKANSLNEAKSLLPIAFIHIILLFSLCLLLVEAPLNFYRISKIYFIPARHWKVSPYCHESTSCIFWFIPICYQGMWWANPCSIILIIQGAPDHSSIKIIVDHNQN